MISLVSGIKNAGTKFVCYICLFCQEKEDANEDKPLERAPITQVSQRGNNFPVILLVFNLNPFGAFFALANLAPNYQNLDSQLAN